MKCKLKFSFKTTFFYFISINQLISSLSHHGSTYEHAAVTRFDTLNCHHCALPERGRVGRRTSALGGENTSNAK